MSQHDFNIANQTFPSFRSDLNDALQAAATMSAGASAPSTPYAYQLWFDTSTNTYKVRNSGNSAWISTITTDLTNGNVGIGTSSITSGFKLEVTGDARFGDAYNDDAVEIGWSAGASQGFVQAYDRAANAFRNLSFNNAVTIDTSGNVLVGGANLYPADNNIVGHSLTAIGQLQSSVSGYAPFIGNRKSSNGDIATFRKDGTKVGSIGTNSSTQLFIGGSGGGTDAGLAFYSAGTIPTSGTGTSTDGSRDLGASSSRFRDLYLYGGVYLGGTGSANHLDDYEDGTFGVSVTGQTTQSTAVTYTKVGRKVTASVYFVCDQSPSGTNALFIGGLPFAAIGSQTVNITIYNWDTSGVTGSGIVTPFIGMSFFGDISSSGFYVRTASNAANPYYQETLLKAGSYIRFNVTYHTT